jgi:hypothetical protein
VLASNDISGPAEEKMSNEGSDRSRYFEGKVLAIREILRVKSDVRAGSIEISQHHGCNAYCEDVISI